VASAPYHYIQLLRRYHCMHNYSNWNAELF
jgi:hypothetical protein